jgi:hypothetical protein
MVYHWSGDPYLEKVYNFHAIRRHINYVTTVTSLSMQPTQKLRYATRRTFAIGEDNKIKLILIHIIQWQYSRSEIQQQNDVPGSTEDKVDSAVVSPLIKSLLMMAHMRPKHVAN